MGCGQNCPWDVLEYMSDLWGLNAVKILYFLWSLHAVQVKHTRAMSFVFVCARVNINSCQSTSIQCTKRLYWYVQMFDIVDTA